MKPKIGDIIEIPLENGKYAYAQYVFFDNQMGPLIQVYDFIQDEPLQSIEMMDDLKPLFPPIIVGLHAAIRVKLWKIVGRKDVEKFIYPRFVTTLYNSNSGKPSTWFLYDGNNDIRLGPKVPDDYRSLEYLFVWSPQTVANRILTGEYPFPYKELIENNEFVPRDNK